MEYEDLEHRWNDFIRRLNSVQACSLTHEQLTGWQREYVHMRDARNGPLSPANTPFDKQDYSDEELYKLLGSLL